MSKSRLTPSIEKCGLGAGFDCIFQNVFKLLSHGLMCQPCKLPMDSLCLRTLLQTQHWVPMVFITMASIADRWCHLRDHAKACTDGINYLQAYRIQTIPEPRSGEDAGGRSLSQIPWRSSKPLACLYWLYWAFPPA